MSIITNMMGLPNIRTIVTVALVGAAVTTAGGLYWKFNSLTNQVEKLTNENKSLIADNTTLKNNTDILRENMMLIADTSLANQVTANNLIKERAEAQKAINTLAASTVADKQTISKLYSRLDDILKDPANDGVVAPALRETIRNIQETRKPYVKSN